jgi:hypothetical protein
MNGQRGGIYEMVMRKSHVRCAEKNRLNRQGSNIMERVLNRAASIAISLGVAISLGSTSMYNGMHTIIKRVSFLT